MGVFFYGCATLDGYLAAKDHRAILGNIEKSSAVRESQDRVVVLDGRQPACVLRLVLQSPSSFPFFSLFPRIALI